MENTEITDPWTLALESLIVEVAKAAQLHNKDYFIGGGFAIDISIGKLTRTHSNINFHPMEEDTEWWKTWFINSGFHTWQDPVDRDFPHAFLVGDSQNNVYIDVHPVMVNLHGEVFQYELRGGHGKWEGKSWNDVSQVNYRGIGVFIEDPESIIRERLEYSQVSGMPLSEKYVHDLNIFHQVKKS